MDRKSICSLLCAMMLAILLISCNDKDDYDGLSPAELSGTYSNKLSAPANGDSLILSYNGNTFIGKDVEFKTDDGKTAHIILKYVLPHDKETGYLRRLSDSRFRQLFFQWRRDNLNRYGISLSG